MHEVERYIEWEVEGEILETDQWSEMMAECRHVEHKKREEKNRKIIRGKIR